MDTNAFREMIQQMASAPHTFTGFSGPVLSILAYVFTALSLYTMAERRGIRHGWLAWIPVINVWVLGSLSDQYRYVVRHEIKSKRKALLTLNIITSVLGIVMACVVGAVIFVLVTCFFDNASEAVLIRRLTVPGMTALILLLPIIGVGIAFAVLRYMAMYDVYMSCDPQNAVLFLVLSILIGVTAPFFLFACRSKDQGMPPRRMTPVEAPNVWSDELDM